MGDLPGEGFYLAQGVSAACAIAPCKGISIAGVVVFNTRRRRHIDIISEGGGAADQTNRWVTCSADRCVYQVIDQLVGFGAYNAAAVYGPHYHGVVYLVRGKIIS